MPGLVEQPVDVSVDYPVDALIQWVHIVADQEGQDGVELLQTACSDLTDSSVDTIVKVGADDLLDVIEAENFGLECSELIIRHSCESGSGTR